MIERRYDGADKPLKRALSELFPEVSYSELSACLRRRDVKVDGARAAGDFLLKKGAVVRIYPQKTREIKVLYEDADLLACYKPKGIASEGDLSFSTLVTAERAGVILMHRLDTNTDGILLFAKNEIAYQEIYLAMKEGRIRKEYLAEVYGVPHISGETDLDYYYKKDSARERAMISDVPREGFIPVHLSFSVVEKHDETALLSVVIHKGKMHQIRAMLAHYGCFILGDGKYGSDRVNRLLGVHKTRLTACAVQFSFSPSSPLSRLNDLRIEL